MATRQIVIHVHAEGSKFSATISRMVDATNKFNRAALKADLDQQIEHARNRLLEIDDAAQPPEADGVERPANDEADPNPEDDKPP